MKTFIFLITKKIALAAFALFVLSSNSIAIASSQAAARNDNPYPAYRITGFMEQNFSYEQDSDDPAGFSIYRARIGVAGRFNELISLNIVAGALEPPLPNVQPRVRSAQLVNAFVNFDIHPMFQLRTGQFLVPFGLEGPEPIFLNPAIERSMTVRRMNDLRMFRDVGIQASGSQNGVSYAIALVNGTGANVAERIDPKDLIGRIGFQATDDLNLGASFHVGRRPVADEPNRFRFGVDATWRYHPLLIRGEYIIRTDEQPDGGNLAQHGGYVLAGYHFNQELQGILRLEMHHPDTDLDLSDSALTILTAGLNYYLQGQTRISLNYEVRGDRRDNFDPGNLLTLQMQIVL